MSDRILVSLDSVPPASVKWLWRGRIPLGGITLLDGDPGDGKSSVMYDLAARVTAGRPMPFEEETSLEAAGVVLLQAEDSVSTTVHPCIVAAGGDPSEVRVYDRSNFAGQPLSLPNDSPIIKAAIDDVNARLVVIDPLAAFLAGSSNSESTVRKALSELAVIAERSKVAIVIVRHLTKGRSGNTKYRGSGSIGIIGAARSALIVADDPSSSDPHQHVLVLNKSNLSDACSMIYRTYKQGDTTRVRWLGESPHGVRQLSESAANQFEHSQLEEACYVLTTILSETVEPVSAKDVQKKAEKALVSQRTLMRAKKKLGVTSRRVVEKDAVQWLWELPKDRSSMAPYLERSTRDTIRQSLGNMTPEAHSPEEHDVEPPNNPGTVHLETDVLEKEVEFETCETHGGRPWDE